MSVVVCLCMDFEVVLCNQSGELLDLDYMEYDDFLHRFIIIVKNKDSDKLDVDGSREVFKCVEKKLFDECMKSKPSVGSHCFDW